MASLDWKDAYYSVKIHHKYRKYLRFYWRGKLYQFTCVPNGLKSAPRMFTKLTKVLIAFARKQGIFVSIYLDDSFTKHANLELARENIIKFAKLSQLAGFVIHPTKSLMDPVQIKTHLGFIINSVEMTIRISEERVKKIIDLCDLILQKVGNAEPFSLRVLAKLV